MQENVVLKPSGVTRAPYTQVSDDGGWQQLQTDGLNAGWEGVRYDGMTRPGCDASSETCSREI